MEWGLSIFDWGSGPPIPSALRSPIDMERAASPLDSSFAEDDSEDTSLASVMSSDDASSIVDDDHFPPRRRSHPAPLRTPLLEKAATEGRGSTASGSKTTDTTSVHEDADGVEEVGRKCNGPGGENTSAQRTLVAQVYSPTRPPLPCSTLRS